MKGLAGESARSSLTSLLLLSLSLTSNCQQVPTVKTTSGVLRGFTPYPNVFAYLGIPYAQPPIRDLRFAPPQPFRVNNASTTIDCFSVSPGCFQLDFILAFSDRETGIAESEDSLSINIWKPTDSNKPLPVMIFLYGGGFTSGANGMFQYSGVEFVAEQKDIIFATINYRVNVFGFPNSPAIQKNVGLLDQRLGVEWLRDNIGSFGGDPNRMTLAGHSAGSQSIAYWSYAYKNDSIVSSLIEFSGQPGLIANDDGSSWKSIANETGCSNADVFAELACMRSMPARSLKRAMSPNNTPGFTDPIITGGTPAVDNVTVFPLSEYTTRAIAGNFAKLPLLVTNTLDEADGVLPFTPTGGVNTTLSDEFTLSAFHCPVAATANYSSQQGVPTWRYLYNGSFAETLPYPWMRPYHGSDLTLVLGKVGATAYQDVGPEVQKAGTYLQNAVASFVRDPVHGLESFGWPRYNVNAPTLVKLFGNNSAAVTFEDPVQYDAACAYM